MQPSYLKILPLFSNKKALEFFGAIHGEKEERKEGFRRLENSRKGECFLQASSGENATQNDCVRINCPSPNPPSTRKNYL